MIIVLSLKSFAMNEIRAAGRRFEKLLPVEKIM
jgi:hypothetical protein